MAPKKNEYDELDDIVLRGMFYVGLPAAVFSMAGCYLMRRRAAAMKATKFEHGFLTVLQYYGFMSAGLGLSMHLYTPYMNKQILEQMPNSEIAKFLRDKDAGK